MFGVIAVFDSSQILCYLSENKTSIDILFSTDENLYFIKTVEAGTLTTCYWPSDLSLHKRFFSAVGETSQVPQYYYIVENIILDTPIFEI